MATKKLRTALAAATLTVSLSAAAGPATLEDCGKDSTTWEDLLSLAPGCAALVEPTLIAICLGVYLPLVSVPELLGWYDTSDCAGAVVVGTKGGVRHYYWTWDAESGSEAIRDALRSCRRSSRGCKEVLRFRFAAAGYEASRGPVYWAQAGDIASARQIALARCRAADQGKCTFFSSMANRN